MESKGRYWFCDWFGCWVGIRPTDDFEEAKRLAIEFQCEVIDHADGNNPVFNCWSGLLNND